MVSNDFYEVFACKDAAELRSDVHTLFGAYEDGFVTSERYDVTKEAILIRAGEIGTVDELTELFSIFESGLKCHRLREEYYPDFIAVSSSGEARVNCAALAEHIKSRNVFIAEVNRGGETVNRYIYRHGVYELMGPQTLLMMIQNKISAINPSLVRMRDVTEVYNNICGDMEQIQSSEINDRQNIINFRNGLLFLDTMELVHRSSLYFTTVQLPCDWEPENTDCPVFTSFLNDLTSGNDKLKELILQYMGACLSNIPGSSFKKALFLTGDGNTGKSQLLNLMRRLLGEKNCALGIGLNTLENDRFATSQLYGKRLCGDAALSFISVKELANFKKLTGGDCIYAQEKGKPQFSFVYKGFLWFSMNKLPAFSGDRGKWVYDRMLIVPCLNVIPPEKQDPLICDKMFAERGAIVNLCIAALNRAVADGCRFTECQYDTLAKTKYQIDNSPALSFYFECCTERQTGETPHDQFTCSFIYEYFKKWCEDNCVKPVSKRAFREEISEAYHCDPDGMIIKTNSSYYFRFTLNEEYRMNFYGSFVN